FQNCNNAFSSLPIFLIRFTLSTLAGAFFYLKESKKIKGQKKHHPKKQAGDHHNKKAHAFVGIF
uniref:hypothetical protein n=1 Tax=Stenotrophomonas maltophilia TaxID=40324 RepID=UPI001954A32A